jgi:threonine dehydrogenase-like Zn-dependent dehydrogenase
MQAIRLEAIGQLHARTVEKPTPGAGELLVRVEACGMRVTGDPNIACGRCSQCRRGRVNLCENLQAIGIHRDGGFAEYVVMPQGQAYALPLTLDPLHGAFCEPLACCLHGVDIAEIKTGASVVVLGGGVIGLLVVQLARLAGATRVVLVTRHPDKRQLAESLGATAALDPSNGDPIAAIVSADGLLPGGADVVIECAGVEETVRQSTQMARKGGTVVILGVMPQGKTVAIEPFDLLFRELRLLGSFVNPFTHRRAADLIASGAVKVAPLISRVVSLADASEEITQPARSGEIRVLVIP